MHSFTLPADNLELFAVTGPDAAKLLQGQLTCDVGALSDPGFTPGALCNNKGRVLATFFLMRQGAAFYLIFNKGLGSVFASALKKYLPFYKCELKQIPPEDNFCFGLVGAAAALVGQAESLSDAKPCANLPDGWICKLGQTRQYLVCSKSLLAATNATPEVATGTLNDWLLAGLQSGFFPFLPQDVEKFTPEELHLDRHNYVSFTKGCYTGQEIVARMHYRGKHKKLLFLLSAATEGKTMPSEPMAVMDIDGRPLGETMKVLQSISGALYALATLPAEMEHVVPAQVANLAGLRFNLRPF